MSAFGNPKIVDDGLVFMYDASNKKSHPGEPTVNLVGSMTKRFYNWNNLTGTTEYYTTSNGGQGVKLMTTSSGGVQWYSNSTIYNIQANTQYTISATVKYRGGTPHPNLLYVRQYDGNGQTSEGGRFTTANQKNLGGGWKRIWRTFTTDSTTTHINLQGYEYSAGRTIFIQDLQFEQKDHNTRFAGHSTTRSATQGFKNRINNATIDVSNASFDGDALLSFDGTDDYVTIDSDSSFNVNTRTVEITFRMNGSYSNFAPLAVYANGTSTSNRVWLGLQNSKFQMHGWGTLDPTATTTINADTWYTCVWSYDLSTQQMKMYTNGVLEKTLTNTQAGVSSASGMNWYLAHIPGSWQGQTYSSVDIKSFKIYDRILTDDEVAKNFNAKRSRFGL